MVKINSQNTAKSTHSILQNCVYMISLAWNKRRSLLFFCLAIAAAAILLSLTQIFIVPVILGTIESAAPISELLSVIALFAGARILLSAAGAYFTSCTLFKRIEVRLSLAAMIQQKQLTTSYPNIENQDFRKKMDKAIMLVNNTAAATEAIWTTLTDLLKNAAGFIICLLLLAALHPLLAAAVLAAAVSSFFIRNHLNGWGYRHRDEESEYSRRMNHLSDKSRDYTLAKDVRIFGMRQWMEEIYAGTLRLAQNFSARGERIYFLGNIADVSFTLIRNIIVYLFLINAVLKGNMSPAQFVLYFNAINAFTNGIGGLLDGFSNLHKQSLDISAVREFLDYPDLFLFQEGIPLTPDLNTSYEITLCDVSFRYPESSTDTLSHINLTIHSGEKLAIVGLNGAGKTTLIKLICGFLDPTEGEVQLNGTNIQVYNRRDYYRLFSAVFQDFSLLDVTVAENITQADASIPIERVKHCIGLAGLTQKISGLSRGLDTHLGKVYEDGIELSGGEIQRLMLARALYKNAPVIVLDEPTAALDPIAENDIYNKYSELTNGRTSLYISHRLASTRFCDRILLLENHGITEEGTHDELIAKGGRYAELYEIQSKYYREGAIHDVQK